VHSGAVALGKRACLGAVWGGEHVGVLGFIGGATGGEKPLAGVPPLLRVYDGRVPPIGGVFPPACLGRRGPVRAGLRACFRFLFYSFSAKCNFVLILVKIISEVRKVQMR
jgi:hypothetical protein